MKKLALAAALLVPLAASANIYSTKHNFAVNANAQASDREICKYCHVPHKNISTRLIWNHELSAATYSWNGTTATKDGTPLPTASLLQSESKRCLSCHDGTVALGNVRNPGGGDTTGADPIFSGASVSGGMMASTAIPFLGTQLGNDPQTGGGNHPVGVPYAGQNGYFGGNSAAAIGEGGYWPQVSGVTQPAAIGGAQPLRLHVDATGGEFGVECGTCHDPHGKPGIPYLLRVTLVESALCRSCHQK